MFNQPILRRAEMLLQLKLGSIIYYDDAIAEAKIVEQFVSMPAGIAIDRRQK
ncbi:unnamed protein product [Soboliphyme baturini]|uniref:Mobile element protein n=1 Tax=Soboliphyme baturini TaxID=241478 RepID=A0A183IXW1_9BILA|nr:unnamed protein product [Soboliphyme baturini]